MVYFHMQEQALKSIVKTLDASVIAIPKEKLSLFPPRAFGYWKTRESLKGKTGVAFDALSAAETAADMTLGLLLHPERASRLIQQKALDPKNLGLNEVLDVVIDNTFKKKHKDSYLTEVQNNVNYQVLFHIMNLAASKSVHPQVNAIANSKLQDMTLNNLMDALSNANSMQMMREIDNFYKHPEQFKVIPAPKIPDGSPIGMDCFQ